MIKMRRSAEKPKGLLLLSGGIDSPVAGHLALKEADLIALHFSSEDITGKESIEKSEKICKKIGIKKLLVCDIGKELAEIAAKCSHSYYFVLMRRLMLRTAEKIAIKEKCCFILTGESLAQVSSQTLSNLAVISESVKMPVARPLLGMEKEEIMQVAERIDTFETSKGKEFCDALGPRHPITRACIENVLREEKKLEIEKMVLNAVKKTKKNKIN